MKEIIDDEIDDDEIETNKKTSDKKQKKVECACSAIILVPLDPRPFNCKCGDKFLHDKEGGVFRLLWDVKVEPMVLIV